MRRAERGVALLEVLAATAILATAGVALLQLVSGTAQAVVTARAREAELADEERLIAAHALLSRRDLDQRLGAQQIGPYVVGVQRPEPTLYRIALGRAAAPGVEDLVTVVHRPEPADAQ